jgi:type IV secretory pathway TrbD component
LGFTRDPGRVFRMARASVALLVIALGLGLALASAFGLLFWAVASAIHGASS